VTSGWGGGLSAARNNSAAALIPGISSYAIFRRNTVYNNWGEGLSCFESDHCTMEDNIVYDNWTVNLYLSDTTNSLVQRNIVYVSSKPAIATRNNGHPSGISLADELSNKPRSANNTIINNFLYNTDLDAFSWTQVANSGLKNVLIANNTIVDGGLFTGVGGSPAIVNVNSQIRNNIILGTDSAIPSKTGITFSNNNWTMPVIPTLGKSTTDIVGNPKIARTGTTTPGTLTSAYFKILAGSPVINAAMLLTNVTDDFFKIIRGTAPDIGGHEFR
jgi:parallel beta-helix repeat protein